MELVKIFDDLIDQTLLQNVFNLVADRGFRYGWHSNQEVVYGHWNTPFSHKGAKSSNRTDIRNDMPGVILKLWESFQPQFLPQTPVLVRAYSNAYTYGNDGYIHQDSQYPDDMTAIIYINKNWNPNWAGETAIFDANTGEIIRSVLPKWRRLLIFPSNMYHVGRGVSRICPHLRTVLVFKARPEIEEADNSLIAVEKTLRDAGIDSASEPKTIEQLLKNYRNLKNWNCSAPVYFAGALYPLYLPNAPLKESFQDVVRPRILDQFGIEADRLAQLFSRIDFEKWKNEQAFDKFDGSEIPLQENDKQFIKLFRTADLLDKSPVIDPKKKMEEIQKPDPDKPTS